MRILVICREFPLPLTSGEKIRCYHTLKGLAKHHEVILISLVQQEMELEYMEELKQLCSEIYPFKFKLSKKVSALKTIFTPRPWEVEAFYSPEMKFKASELINHRKVDIVWVNFLSMAYCLENGKSSKARFILDQHNVDELVWRNYARNSSNIAMKVFASMNMLKIKFFQQRKLDIFDTIICVSAEDENYVRDRLPAKVHTWLIPNGVDTDYFSPAVSESHKSNTIMLCASMDVAMNIDAAIQFATKIFPLVKEQVPDSEFWIVGRNPAPEVATLAKDRSIKVTGTVKDLRPYYGAAKVIVAPYRFGGGTKLKILEAMAMNLPIVSTTIGCQGIDIADIPQVVIKDAPEEFAEAVTKVLESGINSDCSARRLILERYSWNKIINDLESRLSELEK